MPFGAISQPAAGVPTAAGLTALLAKARDEEASAGDVYQDSSTGLCYRYSTVGSGILLPPEWYDRVGPLKTQDSSKTDNGPCYLTLADAEADLTARGWAFVGTPTAKTADNPLIIDGSVSAQHMITSTAGTAIYDLPPDEGVYIIARLSNPSTVAITDGTQSRFEVSNNTDAGGSKKVNISLGLASTAGLIDYGTTVPSPSGAVLAASSHSLWSPAAWAGVTLGTSDGWIQVYFSDSDGACFFSRLDVAGQGSWVPYASTEAGGVGFNRLLFRSSVACVHNYYEIFAFEVT